MTDGEREELLDSTARHEAGHAVMRWLLGLPPTRISIDPEQPGEGFCAGTGRRVRLSPRQRTLLNVAGPVAEACGLRLDIAGCEGEDFTDSRQLIETFPMFFVRVDNRTTPPTCYVVAGFNIVASDAASTTTVEQSVDAALGDLCNEAANILFPHDGLVERLAHVLRDKSRLPARTVARMCREHQTSLRHRGIEASEMQLLE